VRSVLRGLNNNLPKGPLPPPPPGPKTRGRGGAHRSRRTLHPGKHGDPRALKNARPQKSPLTLPPSRQTRMASRLSKRKAFGDHREGVEDPGRDFLIFVNPCTPCLYAITHVIYALPLKNPLTISYGDECNKERTRKRIWIAT